MPRLQCYISIWRAEHSAPGKEQKLNIGEAAFALVWLRKEVTDLRLEKESDLTEGDSSQQGPRAKPK